ncbi:glutathione S-transferase L3-like isoform X4 [Quercus lobata]|uniref:glutathione S-transferase L3-like isoform X3 n=1 Tax=Quercus lobata TaxID=97700 RepID=UPI0012459915|nr:glutathione S-transferase L3-like isoform X3 [Quercus lobata]XP_030932052.1 glutathione S-transferase L3-like isoform X4 [Quercus lobata]
MASLKSKVSYSCSNNNTNSVPFYLSSFCKKVVTQIRFPNTTISPPKLQLQTLGNARAKVLSAKIEAGTVNEVLPPPLDSTSEPPQFFDGTTRLYISYTCPFAQRVWITRNCKGLQDKIKLVILDRENRPAWYKEKINSADKVPTLEHNNEFKGESLDLIKYIDSHFEGPSLFPHDPEKKEFAEELLSYTHTFNKAVFSSFERDGNEAGAAFGYIETALSKFEDEPFFLGQFSLVDIAYAPFIERFQPFLLDVKKYDIIAGRPKLVAWIKEMDKNDAYKQTRREPKELVEIYKKRFSTLL